MNCVSENILRAYHDGELDAGEWREIEAHLASCSACAKRMQEIAATSALVQGQFMSLDSGASETSVDPPIALSRFKARHNAGVKRASFVSRIFARRWRPVWITAVAATFILVSLAFPSGRSLAQRFLATLRIEKVQPVRLDFSALDGNRPLQEMLRQMVSDKVVVTADEKPQHVDTATDASRLAGFGVHLLGARTDAPKFMVEGQHAFHMTVDRTRLQDIFDQAGRPDLLLPATLDGAMVSVNVPRSIRLEYGDCPHTHAIAEEKEAQGKSKSWSNCLALVEAPSPLVNLPSDLNIQQLAEIGFQLSGMNATQARELGQTIDWKSTLVLPMPRFAGSYTQVQVAGTQGTLINGSAGSGRRGPDYVLIWVKSGIIYGLVGHGDSSNAVVLANSLG
jgi:hypothetical protein